MTREHQNVKSSRSGKGFITCTKGRPCRLCGSNHSCAETTDGQLHCHHRHGEDVVGFFFQGLSRIGFGIYSRAFDYLKEIPTSFKVEATPKRPIRKEKRGATSDQLDGRYRQFLHDAGEQPDHPKHVQQLAQRIHVPAAALEALGCVFSDGEGSYSLRERCPIRGERGEILETFQEKIRAWVFPQFDRDGRVAGLYKRIPKLDFKDDKKTHAGGHLGIFLPDGWEFRAGQIGTLYAVEGPTDTAALWAAGFAVVGRPSNMAGVKDLARLLSPLVDKGISFVVVGENDEKPNGQCPGRDGTLHTGQGLADALRVAVKVVLPPEGTKDSRQWFIDHKPRLDDPVAWAGCGRQLEAAWVNIATISPEPKGQLPAEAETPRVVDIMAQIREIRRKRACGELADPYAEEEAAAVKIRDALRVAARKCPNVGPPIHLAHKTTHNRVVGRFACEQWDCAVCREKYLLPRTVTALTQHLLRAEREGKTIYVAHHDPGQDWRSLFYRLRRRGVDDYALVRDLSADGAPCNALFAAGSADAAVGDKISAREAIDLLHAALDSYAGSDDPVLHCSHNWKLSDFDCPGQYERLGYAGTTDRRILMEIAETVNGSARIGDNQKNRRIIDWTEIDVGDDPTPADLEYLDFQIQAGEVVPRCVWEELRKVRAPHSAEGENSPSAECGARHRKPPDFDPGMTPWG